MDLVRGPVLYKIVLAGRKGTGKTSIFKELQRLKGSDTRTVDNSRRGLRERGIWTAIMNSHGSEVAVRQSLYWWRHSLL